MRQSLEALKTLFKNDDWIQFNEVNQLISLTVKSNISTACIHLQGAHVSSFLLMSKHELLWLSPLAKFKKGISIRGGIPICWPWFGGHKDAKLPQHGFARISEFSLISAKKTNTGSVKLLLNLRSSNKTLAIWPVPFSLNVDIEIGRTLKISLSTKVAPTTDIHLTQAIHTYFNVSDIQTTSVNGLDGLTYLDQLAGKTKIQQQELMFTQETDRIYYKAPEQLTIQCERPIHVKQSAGLSTVVWNPWQDKAKLMKDFLDLGYLQMLCVEAASLNGKQSDCDNYFIQQEISLQAM